MPAFGIKGQHFIKFFNISLNLHLVAWVPASPDLYLPNLKYSDSRCFLFFIN